MTMTSNASATNPTLSTSTGILRFRVRCRWAGIDLGLAPSFRHLDPRHRLDHEVEERAGSGDDREAGGYDRADRDHQRALVLGQRLELLARLPVSALVALCDRGPLRRGLRAPLRAACLPLAPLGAPLLAARHRRHTCRSPPPLRV